MALLIGIISFCLAVILVKSIFSIPRRRWKLTIKKSVDQSELWPDVILYLNSSIEAGQSLSAALIELKEASFGEIQNHINYVLEETQGSSTEMVVQRLFPGHSLRLVRLTLNMSIQYGGNISSQLKVCANLLRKKIELKRKVSVLTAQGRMAAWVVGSTPLFLLVMFTWVSPEFIQPLFQLPLGRLFLGGALVLVVSGLYLVHQVVKVE